MINTETYTVSYTGNGVADTFSYPFKILSGSHLEVQRTVAGVVTTLAEGTDYSVAGIGNVAGGSITLAAALASGATLTLTRVVPLSQLLSLRKQGSYAPDSLEDALDLLTMVGIQQKNLRPQVYTTATQPSASSAASGMIYVKDVGAPAVLKVAIQNTDGSWGWANLTVGV